MCINLLLAGYDTSASAGTSMGYLLARGHDYSSKPPPKNADCPFTLRNSLWESLRKEQEEVVAKYGPNIATCKGNELTKAFESMPYLKACMWEAIRVFPTVTHVQRQLLVDIPAEGTTLPAGTLGLLKLIPHKEHDPLRMKPHSRSRRCPFDLQGIDRSALDHDSYDFNPDRWLE